MARTARKSSTTARTTKVAAKPATPAKVPAPKPAPANCGCGCGQPTVTAKATFLAGHDARHAGVTGRALAANPADEVALANLARMSDRLKVKTEAIRVTAVTRDARKAARGVAKAAAEQAFADAMAAV